MSDTRKILVPLDGSALAEQAIPYAKALAGADREITFLHAIADPEPLHGLFGETLATADDMSVMASETARELLRETAERWSEVLESEPRFEVVSGNPSEALLEASLEPDTSLVVIASHGRGTVGRLAFGSVADRISRSVATPLLIIHPDDSAELAQETVVISRIVVPLDGSETSEQAIPVAIEIAKSTGSPVHLLQAINPAALMAPSPLGTAHYPAEMYSELESEMTSAATEELDRASQMIRAAGIPVTQAVLEGAAVTAIEAEVEPGDVIVMTSHGRRGFRRWLLGSVAEKLIHSGLAPVVLVPTKERIAATQAGATG